jgi:hypothetical protein
MPRLLTEKKAEWARKQGRLEMKENQKIQIEKEASKKNKGRGKPSGPEDAKEKKNTLKHPGDGHIALDVCQPAKKAEAANQAKMNARGGPPLVEKKRKRDEDEEERDYDPQKGECAWGREPSVRAKEAQEARQAAREAELARLTKERKKDEKEAKAKAAPSKTGGGHEAGGLRVGCARVGVCVWVRVCFVGCAVCCAVFCAWLHAHARTPAHRHARTTGTNAKLARMERMMADMAAQMAAQMQATMQAGAAVRQVRWGVHGAWHDISCLQT